jgi:hypothetical protein
MEYLKKTSWGHSALPGSLSLCLFVFLSLCLTPSHFISLSLYCIVNFIKSSTFNIIINFNANISPSIFIYLSLFIYISVFLYLSLSLYFSLFISPYLFRSLRIRNSLLLRGRLIFGWQKLLY